ncbi:MAG: LD-carboxypeptidase, partial [Holdemanella porci]
MKYPKFLNEKYNTIGVCAMSSGVGHKLDSFDASIEYIESNGFHIVETASVRNNSEPSIDAKTRVDELNSLVNDSSVGAVWLAAGGDFQFETLPYIDFDWIEKNPKWYLGASDPTNLLFPITCKCDLA